MDLPAPKDNQWLFLDMNAFFAACEQHRQPALRGQPVAVTPVVAATGCVIAASYEAKRRGVTTGWRVGQARGQIPSLKVVQADPPYYMAVHEEIARFLEREITPQLKRLSVDEFAFPLDRREAWTPHADALARRIKTRLAQIFSPALTGSIGIGPNLFLAKLATEIDKPDGLAIIQLHTLEAAYRQLALRDLPGINWAMTYQLNRLGVRTPSDLAAAPRPLLHRAWGIIGLAWWYNLRGYRVSYREEKRQSLSHSHVLAPALRTKGRARSVLAKLWFKVAERLREGRLATSKVTVAVGEAARQWQWDALTRPTQNPLTVFRALAAIYDATLPPTAEPIKLVVVAHGLTPHQANWLGLFPSEEAAVDRLFAAVDTLNHRYGRWTVQPASLLPVPEAAPNRIPFRAPDYPMDPPPSAPVTRGKSLLE